MAVRIFSLLSDYQAFPLFFLETAVHSNVVFGVDSGNALRVSSNAPAQHAQVVCDVFFQRA
jgi:hypothetical protein